MGIDRTSICARAAVCSLFVHTAAAAACLLAVRQDHFLPLISRRQRHLTPPAAGL